VKAAAQFGDLQLATDLTNEIPDLSKESSRHGLYVYVDEEIRPLSKIFLTATTSLSTQILKSHFSSYID